MIAKNDPVEALALCQRTYFDLALLDYEMPLLSGAKLAQEIKYLAPDVPVVLLSGAKLAQEIKYLAPDVPVVLLSGRATLPPSELAFVDSHFGFGTSLDDLLWTMRILTRPKVMSPKDRLEDQRATTQWADST